MSGNPRIRALVLVLVSVGGALPIAAYAWLMASDPRVTPVGEGEPSACSASLIAEWCLAREGASAAGEARAGAPSNPVRVATALEQWTAVLSGFGVKPFYTTLAFVLIVVLWRRRSKDLVALRWALIAFFIGENFCAANYLVYHNGSHLFEYLHSYGMVVCFALAVGSVLEGLDARILRLTEPAVKCAALRLCHRCSKFSEVPCGLERAFRFFLPAVAVVSLMPFFTRIEAASYDTIIFGSTYTYSHSAVYQIFESRCCPLAAALLFLASFVVLVGKARDPVAWAKILFSAGAGAMGFGFLRWILLAAYRKDLVWFESWEEITELIFIVGVAFLLWVFRAGLFRDEPAVEGSCRPEADL